MGHLNYTLIMKTLPLALSGLALTAFFAACSGDKDSSNQSDAGLQPDAEIQKGLTPDSVIKDLIDGNANYASGQVSAIDLKARRDEGTKGQYPKAYILSCVDSRVPVEQVFDQGLGDIFVGRVAGNVETNEQLGSMEYAAAVAGIKVIMVLGHESCGAVKGACDAVKLGNLTTLLEQIDPAIAGVEGHDGERNSKNKEFVSSVIEKNVAMTLADIRTRSEVLTNLEKEGKIKIVGGVYSLQTGKVSLLN